MRAITELQLRVISYVRAKIEHSRDDYETKKKISRARNISYGSYRSTAMLIITSESMSGDWICQLNWPWRCCANQFLGLLRRGYRLNEILIVQFGRVRGVRAKCLTKYRAYFYFFPAWNFLPPYDGKKKEKKKKHLRKVDNLWHPPEWGESASFLQLQIFLRSEFATLYNVRVR